MSSTIRTEDLAKRFRKIDALAGLSLEVPQGAIYALVGPNGAGKTTAIKILMNIFAPSHGRAEVLGIDSRRIRGRAFQSIGYVSENQELPGWMKVQYFFDYLRPFYPTWDRSLENDLVKQFELPLDRRIRHLSRGMRMKAALAGSLTYHPKLIVLDEPFTGLDPLVRDELIQGLLERATESTIFISSHDLGEIETFASHIAYIEQGRLRFAEELTALSDRFREVEVTFETLPKLPQTWPDSWMHPQSSGAVVRFVESRFNTNSTAEKIHMTFLGVRNISFAPMSLRQIFLSMAKAGRGNA